MNDIIKEVLEEIADGQMEMAKQYRIEKQGWRYHPIHDGWIHPDIREGDELVVFENVDDVLEFIAH